MLTGKDVYLAYRKAIKADEEKFPCPWETLQAYQQQVYEGMARLFSEQMALPLQGPVTGEWLKNIRAEAFKLPPIPWHETPENLRNIYAQMAQQVNARIQQQIAPLQGLFHEWEQLAENAVSLESAGQHDEWMYVRDDLKERTKKALGGEYAAVIPADAGVAMAQAIMAQGERIGALKKSVCGLVNWIEEEREGNYDRHEHDTDRDALIARAKQLLGE